ncbi:MAG: ABC transporter ATP-binding protein [Planctomycetota bacterium]|jgi:ABC-type sugar transport system ATPase subunit
MAQVALRNVSKTYPGGVRAVRDLSLEVAAGELLVLLGPSGGGKTTILRIIAGLEKPTTGTVEIDGRLADPLPPHARDVAMVFQEAAVYPHLTVRGNLAFGLHRFGFKKAVVDWRVRETAELLDLAEMLDRRPGELSGGQRQRLALGRALVREPKCFLLDEPLSHLDAPVRTRLRGELRAFQQRLKATMIHVTHDQEEAIALADRLAVIGGGRLRQIGPPREVLARPATSFVAAYVGAPSINLVTGTFSRNGADSWFDDGAGVRVPLVADGDEVDRFEAVLGIRPEALRPLDRTPAGAGGGEAETIDLQVTVCEPVGDRHDVHAQTPGGTPLLARVNGAVRARRGRVVRFRVDPRGVHLFEPGEHGRRIDLGRGD